jgi:hypothetical protein
MASREASFISLASLDRKCGQLTGAQAAMVLATIVFSAAWLLTATMFCGREPPLPLGVRGKTALCGSYLLGALLQWIALGQMKTPLGSTGGWVVFGSLCAFAAGVLACFADSGGGLKTPLASAKPYGRI